MINALLNGVVRPVLRWRGRWIGRKDVTVAQSRGITGHEARRILAERALYLKGAVLEGFWDGVGQINPDLVAGVPHDDVTE